MSAEKRKFPRADLVFKLKYSLQQNPVEIASATDNVSRGGVSFASDGQYQSGSSMTLTFAAEGLDQEISASARVVRSWLEGEQPHTAVEFTDIRSGDLEKIEGLIAEQPAV